MVHKANRSHKSKAERKRLANKRRVKVVGDGRFVQRAAKPKRTGKEVKSRMIRVADEFADWCRQEALKEGSITEVTRKLYLRIKAAEALPQVASNA